VYRWKTKGAAPAPRPGQLEEAVECRCCCKEREEQAPGRRARKDEMTPPLVLWIIPRAMRIHLSSASCSDTSRRYVP
jgi:hypothetical protein